MDYVNNASNSYSSGDTVSSSLANMSITDQHHQENGMGHRSPGDAKMKGQTRDEPARSTERCSCGTFASKSVTNKR